MTIGTVELPDGEAPHPALLLQAIPASVASDSAVVLDTGDPRAVTAYERAFYEAFAAIRPDGLLRKLWIWDDEAGRLRSPVPYEDQIVYAERGDDGSVRRGLAVNIGGRMQQAATFGFVLPLEEPGSTEMLTFFADGDHELAHLIAFWGRCCRDLQSRGIVTGYGTAARRPLPVYRRFGAQIVERAEIDGEIRFLLRFDLRKTWFVRRTGEG